MHFLVTVILFFGCGFSCAYATENKGSFEELYGPALREHKPVALAAFHGSPLLMAFWRSDCTPCMAEMHGLFAAATAHPQVQVALVSLEDSATARAHLASPLPANLHLLVAKARNAQILAFYGDSAMVLPFSRFLHADGTACRSHTGLLGTDRIQEWIESC